MANNYADAQKAIADLGDVSQGAKTWWEGELDDQVALPDGRVRKSVAKSIAELDAQLAAYQEATDEAEVAAQSASQSEQNATAAAEVSGNVRFFDSKSEADTAASGLDEGQIVEINVDESRGGVRTRYRKESGALVFKLLLPRVQVNSIKAMLDLPLIDGLQVDVAAFRFLAPQSSFDGGGRMVYDATMPRSQANGGTVIDPTTGDVYDGTENTLDALNAANGARSGNGCWVRLNREDRFYLSDYGLLPNSDFDIHAILNRLQDVTPGKDMVISPGTYHLSEVINWEREGLTKAYEAIFDNGVRIKTFPVYLEGLEVSDSPTFGFSFNRCQTSRFSNLIARRSTLPGFLLGEAANDSIARGTFDNCLAEDCGGVEHSGWLIDNIAAQFINHMVFNKCESKRSGSHGFDFRGSVSGMQLIGCLAESNAGIALSATSAPRHIFVSGGYYVGGVYCDGTGGSEIKGALLNDTTNKDGHATGPGWARAQYYYVAENRYVDKSRDREISVPRLIGRGSFEMGNTSHRMQIDMSDTLVEGKLANVALDVFGRRSSGAPNQNFAIKGTLILSRNNNNVFIRSDIYSTVEATIGEMSQTVDIILSNVSGTFAKGEIVTGGTSGETAKIHDITGDTLRVYAASGTFSNSETVSGASASGTVSSAVNAIGMVMEFGTNNTVPTGPADYSTYRLE